MQMRTLIPDDADWQLYVDHLKRVKMWGAANYGGFAKEQDSHFAVRNAEDIVAHICIRKQPLRIFASSTTDDNALDLMGPDGAPLYEAFVSTFAVEEAYRRQGYGQALACAKEQGCYQMRSWSSADKDANYALKIKMGFVIQPALYPMPGGDPISGVYFIKCL